MALNVVVWGTGNVGRPAIRAVVGNTALNLSGVIVSNPEKDGKDAAEIAGGIETTGVKASTDWEAVLATKPDAVVYAANADMRPMEAMNDLLACLNAGANVVSTSFYGLSYPDLAPEYMMEPVQTACDVGNSSVFISGIDPGWALDVLPAFLTGVSANVEEIRSREIFNYAHYHQVDAVRNVIGFGKPMENAPMMLSDFALKMVWEPMVRILADKLEVPIDAIETHVERRPLEADVDVPRMGVFEKGTQGAFRFEVKGKSGDKYPIVIEHITRIDNSCAPDWPYPPEGEGCHRVIIKGHPNIHINIHAEDPIDPGPGAGGNATAANRVVNAIPDVCAAPKGIVTSNDLPTPFAKEQIRL